MGLGQQHPAPARPEARPTSHRRPQQPVVCQTLPLHAGAGPGPGRPERRERPPADQQPVHVAGDAQPPRRSCTSNLFPPMPAPAQDADRRRSRNQAAAPGTCSTRPATAATRATAPSACAAPWSTAACCARTATAT
ncbi:MAG: hypothetical protein MZV63_21550 [Marinilabiliales bacterium]|nr:hypothetical protein [Marinilabiliales bacterium]